jgi:hypothetical protein
MQGEIRKWRGTRIVARPRISAHRQRSYVENRGATVEEKSRSYTSGCTSVAGPSCWPNAFDDRRGPRSSFRRSSWSGPGPRVAVDRAEYAGRVAKPEPLYAIRSRTTSQWTSVSRMSPAAECEEASGRGVWEGSWRVRTTHPPGERSRIKEFRAAPAAPGWAWCRAPRC